MAQSEPYPAPPDKLRVLSSPRKTPSKSAHTIYRRAASSPSFKLDVTGRLRFTHLIGMLSHSCTTHDSPSPRVLRLAEAPIETGPTPPETEVVMADITRNAAVTSTSVKTAAVRIAPPTMPTRAEAGVPITWHTPTPSRWVAYRDATRIGSIDHVGAFIATNQHMDVLGAFVNLADAQLAIVDPQPAGADLIRRTRARSARRDARLRRAALITMGALFVMLLVGAAALFVATR